MRDWICPAVCWNRAACGGLFQKSQGERTSTCSPKHDGFGGQSYGLEGGVLAGGVAGLGAAGAAGGVAGLGAAAPGCAAGAGAAPVAGFAVAWLYSSTILSVITMDGST